MNTVIAAKKLFLNSLDERQRKFFLTNEHRTNIVELLEEQITYNQHKLYEAWQLEAKKVIPKSDAKIPDYPEFFDNPDFDSRKAETAKIIIQTGRIAVLDNFFQDQTKYQKEYLRWKQLYLAKKVADRLRIETKEIAVPQISEDIVSANKENKPKRRARSKKKMTTKPAKDRKSLTAIERKEISDYLQATMVPIELNNTVKDNDDGFIALHIDLMGQKEWNRRFPKNTIVIYTDGSCFGSEASGAGIYHGPLHDLNRAYNLSDYEHNSGFAEIAAAVLALNDLKVWKDYKNQKVVLRTDFLPMVKAMQNVNSIDNSRFPEFYNLLRQTCSEFPNGVEFQHVYAHDSSDADPGNDAADEFARQAAASGNLSVRSKSRSGRNRSQVRGRAASRSNCLNHIRSHSAFILANNIRPPLR